MNPRCSGQPCQQSACRQRTKQLPMNRKRIRAGCERCFLLQTAFPNRRRCGLHFCNLLPNRSGRHPAPRPCQDHQHKSGTGQRDEQPRQQVVLMKINSNLMTSSRDRDSPHPDICRHTFIDVSVDFGPPARIPSFGQHQQRLLFCINVDQQRVRFKTADGRRRAGQDILPGQRLSQRFLQQRAPVDVVTLDEPAENRSVIRHFRRIDEKARGAGLVATETLPLRRSMLSDTPRSGYGNGPRL